MNFWKHLNLFWSFHLQTVSAILSALLANVLRPDLQARAQAELDAATGRERLPTFEDRPMLPFVDALCKETQRWRPVTPLGALIAIDDYSRISIHRRTKHFLILSPKTMSMKACSYQKVCHLRTCPACHVTNLPMRRGGAWKYVVSSLSLCSARAGIHSTT